MKLHREVQTQARANHARPLAIPDAVVFVSDATLLPSRSGSSGHRPARPRRSAFFFLFSDYDRPVRRSCTKPAVAGRMVRLLCMISAFSPFDQSAIGSYRERAGFLQYRACAASFFPFRSSLTSFRFAADIARGVVQCGLCAGMRPARSDGVHQSCSCYSNGRGPEAGGVPLPRPEGPAACTGTALFEAVRPLVALVSTRS